MSVLLIAVFARNGPPAARRGRRTGDEHALALAADPAFAFEHAEYSAGVRLFRPEPRLFSQQSGSRDLTVAPATAALAMAATTSFGRHLCRRFATYFHEPDSAC